MTEELQVLKKEQFTETKKITYVAEASDLGWEVGYRPTEFIFEGVIYDLHFTQSSVDELDTIFWEYHARYYPDNQIVIKVFND